MRRVLTLVATGIRPDFPGEVTVHFREVDFPFVEVIVDRDPRPDPYEVCTLDYAVEGRPAELAEAVSVEGRELPAGARGRAVVATTVGQTRHVRIVLDGEPDAPINVAPESLRWLDELPGPGGPPGGAGPKPN
jgi:hypothetical protein